LAAGLRPDPLGELTALPKTPSCIKGGEGREMGMKGTVRSREKRDQGKEMGTLDNGVCVPYCGSALLATI